MQADSHELLMEILNSGAATAVNVNNLIQFDVITKGIILCLLICIQSFTIKCWSNMEP